ncbi:MAG: hypothetical protein K2H02_04380 [Anaeroplasmataceae bacterium]|nr:hypothetical protein [Anaeroplasmataceae bacterium]MDE5868162.1 hypothetical protein [Anaeroplasmataceae bacterium]
MNLEAVKELLMPYLKQHHLMLYDIAFTKEYGYLTLQVLIDKEGGIDIDDLSACNEYLSAELDKIDADMQEYMLEVSSPGAEKELRTIEEIKGAIQSYVHIEIENMIYEGILENVSEDNVISIRYNAKGRFKIAHIAYNEIKLIRLAVKI